MIANQERATRLDLPFAGEITFKRDEEELTTQVLTANVSATGGYFIADTLLKAGDLVAVQLYWHPRGEPEVSLKAVGKVTRVDHLLDETCVFAVRFEDLPDWQQG